MNGVGLTAGNGVIVTDEEATTMNTKDTKNCFQGEHSRGYALDRQGRLSESQSLYGDMMRLFRSKRMLASTLLGASLLLVAGCSLDVAMNNIGRVQIQVADTSGNPVPNINAD